MQFQLGPLLQAQFVCAFTPVHAVKRLTEFSQVKSILEIVHDTRGVDLGLTENPVLKIQSEENEMSRIALDL